MADLAPAQLAQACVAAAATLHRQQSLRHTLGQMVELAATTVPGADHASITILRRGGVLESLAHTHEVVRELDLSQARLGAGPSVASVTEQAVLLVPDTAAHDTRWPDFLALARELRVGSVLTCRLTGARGALGSLSLHSRQPHAFDDASVRTATIYCAHAAVAVSHAGLVHSLNTALTSRQNIGEATGMLMERYGATSSQAFGMLVRASQNRNTKLRDVAAHVVATGRLPEEMETAADTTRTNSG